MGEDSEEDAFEDEDGEGFVDELGLDELDE